LRNENSASKDLIWLKNYEIAIDLVRMEGDRIWTRWNLFLILETALFGAFLLLFPIEELPLPKNFASIIISILGIISGYLWYILTVAGEAYQLFFVKKAAEIEASHPELNRIMLEIEGIEKRFPVMKYAKIIPCVFIFVWVFLTLFGFYIPLAKYLN